LLDSLKSRDRHCSKAKIPGHLASGAGI
jgi:S1-C subfamily serine protease